MGIKLDLTLFRLVISDLRTKIAIINPVVIAKFFNIIIKGIIEILIKLETGEMGVLGYITTYFGVIESIFCGILYYYILL